jgi:hypothetical protein
VEFAIWPQDLLTQWLIGSLLVGVVLFVGGAWVAGAALSGSSICSVLAYLLKGLYGGDHLETLVHGAVILGSVGLVGFGLAGLALGTYGPLGRYPMALVLAFGTVVVGTRLVLGIHAGAALPCSPRLCYRGKSPGFRGCLRSTSPSSQRCSWCRPGGRRGHRGRTKTRTIPSWTGWSDVPLVAGGRSDRR